MGRPPGAAHGVDVDDQGNGTVIEQRMYQLIRQSEPIADRQFEIEFLDSGVEAFALRSADRLRDRHAVRPELRRNSVGQPRSAPPRTRGVRPPSHTAYGTSSRSRSFAMSCVPSSAE